MRLVTAIWMLLLPFISLAQEDEWEGDTGRIVLQMPVEVEALLERHKQYLKKVEGLPGFRIQVAATSTLQDIKGIREEFEEEFEGYQTYTVFQNPNYKLLVGDYRSRIDAHRDLMKIRKEFAQAFISQGSIDIMAP